jgi:drug/metabolite transporter (DMT)-like permease
MNKPTPFHDPSVLFGMLAVVLACFILAGMDGLGKLLMQSLPTQQVVWARYFFHTLIVGLVFTYQSGSGFIRPNRPGLQLVRAACLLGVTLSIYFAIRTISLADATAIVFFAPVLVTLLAGMLLHEKVGLPEWLAVVLGFVGVLFVVQPGFRQFEPAMMLALAGSVCLAFYFVLTRALKGQDSEQTTLFHSTALGAVGLTCLMPLWWVAPSASEWGFLVLMGVMGASGHFLLVKAFHLAEAPLLSPFLNAQLVAAVLVSVIFFDDQLGLGFYFGAALIVGAGLIVWAHERILNAHNRRRLNRG